MQWESFDSRRSTGSRRRSSGFPIPPRIIAGALAIAIIVLAFIARPAQQPSEPAKAAPDARPTIAAAAVVSVPTIAPPAPTPIPTASAPAPTGKVHEVVQGDTLSSIAKKYYGDASKWSKILDANKDILKSPESLQLGQKLKIPD